MSSEWPVMQLGDLIRHKKGFAFKSSDYRPSGVPVIRVSNFTEDSISSADLKFVSLEVAGKNGDVALAVNDIVVATVGSWPNNPASVVGRTVSVPLWANGSLMNQNSVILRAKSGELADQRFIYYQMKSAGFSAHIISKAQGSANQASITLDAIFSFQLWWPELSTRKEICSLLDAVDDRITLLRETNATLEAIAQALFKSWFVDFDPVHAKAEGRQPEGMDATTAALFPDSFEESELGLVPRGWGVVPFLDACDLQGGAQPPAATFIDEPRDGYVRLLQIRDFSTDAHKTYIPDTGKLKKVTEDDVLIGRYGSASGDKAKDSLGRVCRGLSGSYNVALMKLCPVQVGREYALQLVSDSSFYGYLQGVSSKAVQSGFSKAELGQYKVIMPPSDLAEAFEQFGKAVWERVKANRELAQTLTQLRDTLLPRLISGQLRLPEAESLLENAL